MSLADTHRFGTRVRIIRWAGTRDLILLSLSQFSPLDALRLCGYLLKDQIISLDVVSSPVIK